MKYFLDTEFLEGSQMGFFGKKTKPTIDLISIGIVAEDGREYYAISKDFNLKEAWNRYDLEANRHYPMGPKDNKIYWIRQNVLKLLHSDLVRLNSNIVHNFPEYEIFSYKTLEKLLRLYGKTNTQIAIEIQEFCSKHRLMENPLQVEADATPKTFYTYYGDYDWVVFCWLFGKMINLPKGFPMYSCDLKQMLDQTLESNQFMYNNNKNGVETYNLENKLRLIKSHKDYPKPTIAHNAIADARWNKKLYEFIQSLVNK